MNLVGNKNSGRGRNSGQGNACYQVRIIQNNKNPVYCIGVPPNIADSCEGIYFYPRFSNGTIYFESGSSIKRGEESNGNKTYKDFMAV